MGVCVLSEAPTVGATPKELQRARQQRAVFLEGVHAFRGVAILFIVAGHVVSCFTWQEARLLGYGLESVFQNGTVYFVFIAGFLFRHLSEKHQYGSYLKRKAQNVLLPYLIMSAPAVVLFTCFVRRWDLADSFYEKPLAVQVMLFYLTGSHLTTYWFVPMICLYYLLSPFFLWWDRHQAMYLLLPAAIGVSLVVARGSLAANSVHFFSVYLLGMFVSRYRHRVFTVVARLKLGLIVLATACILAEVFQARRGTEAIAFVQKVTLCVLFLWWLRDYRGRAAGVLNLYADASFGIYFVHPYVINALKAAVNGMSAHTLIATTSGGSMGEGSVLAFIVFCSIVCCVSLLLILFARRLLGSYSRMMVGS